MLNKTVGPLRHNLCVVSIFHSDQTPSTPLYGPILESRPLPWKFIYSRNVFHAFLIIISNWGCRAMIYVMIIYFLLSRSGTAGSWSCIPTRSSRQSRFSNFCYLLPEYRRLSQYYILSWDFGASRFTSKLRYPITKFCVSRIPHCSRRSSWPDLLPGLLKCRILLSTGKSLFIEY